MKIDFLEIPLAIGSSMISSAIADGVSLGGSTMRYLLDRIGGSDDEKEVSNTVRQLKEIVKYESLPQNPEMPWEVRPKYKVSPLEEKRVGNEDVKNKYMPDEKNILDVLTALDPLYRKQKEAVTEGTRDGENLANFFRYRATNPDNIEALNFFSNALDKTFYSPIKRVATYNWGSDPLIQNSARIILENQLFKPLMKPAGKMRFAGQPDEHMRSEDK